jgi:C-terminal processing protease CtpA/Prc
MHLKLKFCATLTISLLVLSGTIFAQKDFFTELRKSYSVATFLSTAKYLNDYNTSLEKTLSALKKEKLDFRKSDTDSVRVGALCYYVKNKGIYTHYSSKDGSCWFDIFNHPSADSIKHYAEYLNSKRQAFSNIGNNFSVVNTFLTADSKTKSAVGAFINGGKIIFNFGFDLPFPVKYFDSLSTSRKKTVLEKAEKLFKVLKIITDNFIDPSEMIYYPGADKKLTADERLFGLIQFWTEAKYNFAFFDKIPEVDWDKTLLQYIPVIQKEQTISEYYKNMIKLCALLKDGHTNIYPPNDYYADTDSPMLRLKNIQNKAVIVNEGVSLGNSIPIGSVITKVNGLITEEFLRKEIFPFISSSTEYILYDWGIRDMLDGKKGSSVTITIKTPDGKEKEVKIVRKSGNEKWLVEQNGGSWNLVDFKRLSDGIVYTNIKTFGTEKVNEEFDKLVDSIKTAKGLIIDLRNNGGGNSGTGYGIINHLTDKPYVTSKWKTREHKPAFKAWGSYFVGLDKSTIDKMDPADKQQAIESINTLNGNSWFEGKPDTITPPKGEKINIPVVVLTGHNTASAAEDFLIAMDGLKRAKVVGDRTFGSTGQPMVMKLPGGGSARICTKRDTYPDGREFVGYGVAPDVFVEQTVEDYLANKDVVLEKGIEVLKKSIVK